MCGIIARISQSSTPAKTLQGLRFLEYRGYDSYGILLVNDNNETLCKESGEIPDQTLQKLQSLPSHLEIGHTRWATHGKATKVNAHPHFDSQKQFFVAMNGIVENYFDLKKKYKDNIHCISESDTEMIPHLYNLHFQDTGNTQQDMVDATRKVIQDIEGEFSFVVRHRNTILAYKNMNPLIVGKSTSPQEILICSDIHYIQNNSEAYTILNDNDICVASLEDQNLQFQIIPHTSIQKTEWHPSIKSDTKSQTSYPSYMEQEIHESQNLSPMLTQENLHAIQILLTLCKSHPNNIVLTAAGTSYHAAYFLHYALLKHNIYTHIILASELHNYTDTFNKALILAFSQSGETADLIYPLKALTTHNTLFTITNTPNSTLDRLASHHIYLNAGQEISVAATKTFSFQIYLADIIDKSAEEKTLQAELETHFQKFQNTLAQNTKILQTICHKFQNSPSFFFIGRNQNHPLALEGALKLKEVSYIHAEGFAGGELKHGTLALIQAGTPVVVLGDDKDILSNATEIKTRGGCIVGIAPNPSPVFDYHLSIPSSYQHRFITLLLQYLTLQMAYTLNLDPDKPRNLAKSITVK